MAEVDMNIVMNDDRAFIEIQGTAEGRPFSKKDLDKLLALGESGIRQLFEEQKKALGVER